MFWISVNFLSNFSDKQGKREIKRERSRERYQEINKRLREGEIEIERCKGNNSCHFFIHIFFLVFYVNIQPLHYYLGKLSQDRLTGKNYQREVPNYCLYSIFFFRLKTKKTQSNSQKMSIWSTLKLLRKKCNFLLILSNFN